MPDDPKRPNLFPADVLWKIANRVPVETTVPPADEVAAAANRREVFGPLYDALAFPSTGPGDLSQALAAEGALSLVPAALLAPYARPLVDRAYAIIDKVPEALRRPLEKDLGLLIDQALSFLADAAAPLVGQTLEAYAPGGRGLPGTADLDLQTFSQVTNGCGETAAATVLKAAGEPIALGDVDTQVAGAPGSSGQLGAELRRRGLTVVSGPMDLAKLRTFVAAGMPVLVQVGWAEGGGHFAVVSGYDDSTRQLTIRNWDAQGGTVKVGYDEFDADWARAMRAATVVLPARDPRLAPLEKAGDLRRPTPIYTGLTLSDFYVTETGKVYVEGAFRYVGESTDVTVRVGYDTSEEGLDRRLGGSIAVKRRLAPDWYLGLQITKLSLQGQADDWHSFQAAPLAIYGALRAHGLELKAGEERGGFQASLAADLGTLVSGLGLSANVSVDADGTCRVTGVIAGTF